MRKTPGWSDFERNLFIVECGKEVCRICDTDNKPGTIWCSVCAGEFRESDVVFRAVWAYSYEEIERMRREWSQKMLEQEILSE